MQPGAPPQLAYRAKEPVDRNRSNRALTVSARLTGLAVSTERKKFALNENAETKITRQRRRLRSHHSVEIEYNANKDIYERT